MRNTTVAKLNKADKKQFVDALDEVYEESPWVPERAYADRPFNSIDDVAATLESVVREASYDQKLALLRAHPDLGEQTEMTDASEAEQASAGLDQLSPELYNTFQRLNRQYRERFGFPFIKAVKGHSPKEIREAMEQRVTHSQAEEFNTALAEVHAIARLRLNNTLIA
jgi:2-oxo-4-hydroxy-4-carboxy-5-ureidoimidazoline decarboxylase